MEKGHEPSRAKPSQAENLSARAMAPASSAQTHHYYITYTTHLTLNTASIKKKIRVALYKFEQVETFDQNGLVFEVCMTIEESRQLNLF